jgi:hypothetical protein
LIVGNYGVSKKLLCLKKMCSMGFKKWFLETGICGKVRGMKVMLKIKLKKG